MGAEQVLFDDYAENYDETLEQALAVSGESKDYFARARVAWLARRLRQIGARPSNVLDFGCGMGSATTHLLTELKIDSVVGVDVSAKSLEVARRLHDPAHARFELIAELAPAGSFDLAFCNGVFHHIPISERPGAVDYIFRSLRPGGCFGIWENNPFNPGTRYVMSQCEFDRDAILLWPGELRRLLRNAGFAVLRTDFLFIFPRLLRAFRPLEPLFSRLPIGAQFQVLCKRPG